MKTHAQLPTPLQIDRDIYRFYFSSRDEMGRSRPFFVDYCMSKKKVITVTDEPVLELGEPGMFDDSGIMPSSIVKVGDVHYLYYIGWNQRKNISYQLAIGLAISTDGGNSFHKYSKGPILDRNIHDPIFCAAPCVHLKDGSFTMWYISATGWPSYGGQPEPVYLVKSAKSQDGKSWKTQEDVAIPYKFKGEAIGRPWVLEVNGKYHMWYSSRGSDSYRHVGGQHYQIGYAQSEDGNCWTRHDRDLDLLLSTSSWDSEMQEYTAIFEHNGKFYMLYNGNTFGRDGFGLAVLEA